MKELVLISGGSGLIGRRLSAMLTQKGYAVRWLTRNPSRAPQYPSYAWDVDEGRLDAAALEGVNYIVHLAGAPIAERRWTDRRKKQIAESRIKGATLLYEAIAQRDHRPKALISASGINYYAVANTAQIFTEGDAPGTGFLPEVCVAWEAAARRVEELGLRSVQLRTPVVLSLQGGALPKVCRPFKLNLGAPLGDGKQPFPWIHLDDLVALYSHALENELEGPYNAVAPDLVHNQSFSKALARAMDKAFFMPAVPAFALKLLLGERSDLLLKGLWASPKKSLDAGFTFTYPNLDLALEDLFSTHRDTGSIKG